MSSAMENLLEIVSAEDSSLEEGLGDLLPEPSCTAARPAAPVPEVIDASPAGVQAKAREIRAAFMSAKSTEEVYHMAQAMSFPAWLDFFIKLSPKEVQVKGQMDIRQITAQLGPINRRASASDSLDSGR